MHINLTLELERRISGKIESGQYSSAGEIVQEGLKLLL